MHQLVALLIIAQTSKDSYCATRGLVVHVQSEEGGYPLTENPTGELNINANGYKIWTWKSRESKHN
jgi:hypothetical protein